MSNLSWLPLCALCLLSGAVPLWSAPDGEDANFVAGCLVSATDGTPVVGVTARLLETQSEVTSGESGCFRIVVDQQGPWTLALSAAGFRSRRTRVGPESSYGAPLLQLEPLDSFSDLITVGVDGVAGGATHRVIVSDTEHRTDQSAAELSSRLAGVLVLRDRGEADRVVVRGTDSRMVSTTLDGERLASPSGEKRTAGLASLPSELVQEIRVSKVLTPEMDGDAIGGVVDLITLQPPQQSLTRVGISAAAGEQQKGVGGGAGLVLGGRTQSSRTGWLLSVSSSESPFGSDQIEARYADEGLARLELLDFVLDRRRQGMTASIERAISDHSRLFARGTQSALSTTERRRRAKFDIEEAEVEREIKDSNTERTISNITAGGYQLLASGAELDYRFSYSGASDREPNRIDTSFVQNGAEFIGDGLDIRTIDEELSSFAFDKLGLENNTAREDNVMSAASLSLAWLDRAHVSSSLKLGLKGRHKEKYQDLNTTLFSSAAGLDLSAFVDPLFAPRGFFDGAYDLGPTVHRRLARQLLESGALQGALSFEEEAADYAAQETTTAAFAQTEIRVGERLTLLTGVRFERTQSAYSGFEVFSAPEGGASTVQELAGRQTWDAWLPGLHATYRSGSRLMLRGSMYRSLSRPNYFDLVPFRIVDFEDQEVDRGNADLRPTLATHFDLGVEWGTSATTTSFSLFHKALDDFIFDRRGLEEIDGTLFEVSAPSNGERAVLRGLELTARHRFSALEWLEGFAVSLHLTATESGAEFPAREGQLSLPGQPARYGWLELEYETRRLRAALSAEYVSGYLFQLGDQVTEDLHARDILRANVSLSADFDKRVGVSFRLDNLTDASSGIDQGLERLTYRVERTGRTAHLGVSLRF